MCLCNYIPNANYFNKVHVYDEKVGFFFLFLPTINFEANIRYFSIPNFKKSSIR